MNVEFQPRYFHYNLGTVLFSHRLLETKLERKLKKFIFIYIIQLTELRSVIFQSKF